MPLGLPFQEILSLPLLVKGVGMAWIKDFKSKGSSKGIFLQSHPISVRTSFTSKWAAPWVKGPWIKFRRGPFLSQLPLQKLRLLCLLIIIKLPLLKVSLPRIGITSKMEFLVWFWGHYVGLPLSPKAYAWEKPCHQEFLNPIHHSPSWVWIFNAWGIRWKNVMNFILKTISVCLLKWNISIPVNTNILFQSNYYLFFYHKNK